MDMPSSTPSASVVDDHLVARLLVVGLAVHDAVDLDVEHVQLAVDRLRSRRRGRRAREVLRSLSLARARSEIEPATRSMPSSRAISRAHVVAGAVERLGAGARVARACRARSTSRAARPARAPSAAASRTSRSAVARLRAASSVELSWIGGGAHGGRSPRRRLTGQSTGQQHTAPGMPPVRPRTPLRRIAATAHPPGRPRPVPPPPRACRSWAGAAAQALALRRRLRRRSSCCAPAGACRAACRSRSGRCGTARAARCASARAARRGGVGRSIGRPGGVLVRDGGVAIDLALDEGDGVETVAPHGGAYIWTRKQGGVRGARDASCVDGAGASSTRPPWSTTAPATTRATRRGTGRAGVGRAADGRALAWNLVAGIHDSPRDSERTVWVDGVPREAGPAALRRRPERVATDAAATCASPPRRRARAATTCCSCAASTRSRSARSPAPSPAPGRRARTGLRRDGGAQRFVVSGADVVIGVKYRIPV